MKWDIRCNLVIGIITIISSLIEGFFFGRIGWILFLGIGGIINIIFFLYFYKKLKRFVLE